MKRGENRRHESAAVESQEESGGHDTDEERDHEIRIRRGYINCASTQQQTQIYSQTQLKSTAKTDSNNKSESE